MSYADVLKRRPFGGTLRKDTWWVQPLLVFLGFSAFIVYSTWAAFQNEHYTFGPYLSPMYSPELVGSSPHAWFGPQPAWWPSWLPFSPAFLILWAPGGFRFTCYYYRGAYYKAFWGDPPACAVGEPRNAYRGEHKFPLILQNVHRYFLYLALAFVVMLSYDVILATRFPTTAGAAGGATEFGIGLGTLVMAINVVLIASYTFSCHSLRHLIGGGSDCMANAPAKLRAWKFVSCLNRRHMLYAWMSLFWVGFTDVYIRLCSMGVWSDWRIL